MLSAILPMRISSCKNGVKKVLEVFDLCKDTFNRWRNHYKEHDINGRMNDKKRSRLKRNEE